MKPSQNFVFMRCIRLASEDRCSCLTALILLCVWKYVDVSPGFAASLADYIQGCCQSGYPYRQVCNKDQAS